MILSWYRRRRRARLMAQPFPEAWEAILQEHLGLYEELDPQERQKLHRLVQVMVGEKYWEGCNGLEMTDEIRVTIAGQACLLLLGFEDRHFDRLLSVLVYPDTYVVSDSVRLYRDFEIKGTSARLGEAWYRGPVVLSWPDVLDGVHVPDDGHNVVLHEFAHLLDMENRDIDGVPALSTPEEYRRWTEVTTAEYQRLIASAERRRRTLLDPYGATSPAEFFAVATEVFFEQPGELAEEHPELYDVLRAYYRQDPAARVERFFGGG